MKKQLIIIMRNLAMGGAENVLINYLKSFDRSKYTISLILHTKEGELLSEVPADVVVSGLVPIDKGLFSKVLRVVYKRLLFYLPAILKIYYKRKYGTDKIIVSFMEGISTNIATTFTGPKVAFVHIDVVSNPWADNAYRSFRQQADSYQRFQKIIFVSQSGATAFKQRFGMVQTPYQIIHNVIDPTLIEKRSRIFDQTFEQWKENTAGTFRIISVGRANEVKRFELLIQAFAKFSNEEAYSLTIVGGGVEFNALRKVVEDLGLAKAYLMGMQMNPLPYIATADLFVNSSRVESYPTVLVESLVLETPVLATRNGGAEEVLEAGRFGRLIKNELSADELATAISLATLDEEELKDKAISAQGTFSAMQGIEAYDMVFNALDWNE